MSPGILHTETTRKRESKRTQRAKRYAAGRCVECNKDRRGDKRTLCAACRDKWKAVAAKQYQDKKARILARNAEWKAANRERMRKNQREWLWKKRDRIAEFRELTELALSGAIRVTPLDLYGGAA